MQLIELYNRYSFKTVSFEFINNDFSLFYNHKNGKIYFHSYSMYEGYEDYDYGNWMPDKCNIEIFRIYLTNDGFCEPYKIFAFLKDYYKEYEIDGGYLLSVRQIFHIRHLLWDIYGEQIYDYDDEVFLPEAKNVLIKKRQVEVKKAKQFNQKMQTTCPIKRKRYKNYEKTKAKTLNRVSHYKKQNSEKIKTLKKNYIEKLPTPVVRSYLLNQGFQVQNINEEVIEFKRQLIKNGRQYFKLQKQIQNGTSKN